VTSLHSHAQSALAPCLRPLAEGRCHIDYGDGTACPNLASYQARLTWTAGLMLLCEDHAAEERAHGDVLEIRSIHTSSGS
jgi:hypothetical protein